jgi:stringent starvation protein B
LAILKIKVRNEIIECITQYKGVSTEVIVGVTREMCIYSHGGNKATFLKKVINEDF